MHSKKIPLSISLVTYKTEPAILEEALASIANSTLPAIVYIVDNSPTDVLRSVAARYKTVYIHTERNMGFGCGHNLALQRIGRTSDYHLVLNPDISFGSTVLEELYGFMELNPQIGWVMPNILYPDGSRQNLCKRLPTPWDLFTRRFLMHYGLGVSSQSQVRFECRDLDLSKPRAIPYLSGCFAFVRTDLIQAVGGFDERFFMYLEDTDLVRRIGELSMTVFYPYTGVYHLHGKGSYRNLKLLGHHLLSAVRYFAKWGWLFDSRRVQVNRAIDVEKQDITVPDRIPLRPELIANRG